MCLKCEMIKLDKTFLKVNKKQIKENNEICSNYRAAPVIFIKLFKISILIFYKLLDKIFKSEVRKLLY